MNVTQLILERFCPQITLQRGLRRLRNHSTIKRQHEVPVVSRESNHVLQIPMTEQELTKLVKDESRPVDEIPLKPRKEKKTLHQRIMDLKPDYSKMNQQIVEPITPENQYDKLAEILTPLHQTSYDLQLKVKQEIAKDFMKVVSDKIEKSVLHLKSKGIKFPMEQVVPSPEIIAYRNKDDFGIDVGVDGNPKTVGYFIGKYTDPLKACVPVTHLINIKESHKLIAQRFQTFIRQSPHKVYRSSTTDGIWHNLKVRSSRMNEKMATVCIHSKGLTEDQILEVMADLEKFFFDGEGADCELDSLYYQDASPPRSREVSPFRLIRGKEHLTDICCDLKLKLSPNSEFMVNTAGAEGLYKVAKELAGVTPFTTVLDPRCGFGPVSLLMSHHARGVVGIDSSAAAIQNAKINAALNNITKVNFIRGKAEEVIQKSTDELNCCTEVVAVLNPGLSVFKSDTIKAIRQCESINRVVFMCQAGYTPHLRDFSNLTTTKDKFYEKVKAPPFRPRCVIPVDVIPHTYFVSLAILFERTGM